MDMPDTLSTVYTHKLAAGVLEEDAMLEVRAGGRRRGRARGARCHPKSVGE
jgi:hypothetical protein